MQDLQANPFTQPPQGRHTTSVHLPCRSFASAIIANYGYVGQLQGNGCWWAGTLNNRNKDWKICHADGSVQNPDALYWYYDDTNPSHPKKRELSLIKRCSTGAFGMVSMAPRPGWRPAHPKGVKVGVYHAQLYYTQNQTIDETLFARWHKHPHKALPVVNISHASPAEVHKAVLKVCRAYPGFIKQIVLYFYRPHEKNVLPMAQRKAITRALDQCTKG